jgi:hypothetical protein
MTKHGVLQFWIHNETNDVPLEHEAFVGKSDIFVNMNKINSGIVYVDSQ